MSPCPCKNHRKKKVPRDVHNMRNQIVNWRCCSCFFAASLGRLSLFTRNMPYHTITGTVVPVGQKFEGERTYQPKKEFAYRMLWCLPFVPETDWKMGGSVNLGRHRSMIRVTELSDQQMVLESRSGGAGKYVCYRTRECPIHCEILPRKLT